MSEIILIGRKNPDKKSILANCIRLFLIKGCLSIQNPVFNTNHGGPDQMLQSVVVSDLGKLPFIEYCTNNVDPDQTAPQGAVLLTYLSSRSLFGTCL